MRAPLLFILFTATLSFADPLPSGTEIAVAKPTAEWNFSGRASLGTTVAPEATDTGVLLEPKLARNFAESRQLSLDAALSRPFDQFQATAFSRLQLQGRQRGPLNPQWRWEVSGLLAALSLDRWHDQGPQGKLGLSGELFGQLTRVCSLSFRLTP